MTRSLGCFNWLALQAHEEVFSVSIGTDGAIYLAGAFTSPFVVTPGTAHDVFDMVGAGRPFAVGCGLFNPNTAAITVKLAKVSLFHAHNCVQMRRLDRDHAARAGPVAR